MDDRPPCLNKVHSLKSQIVSLEPKSISHKNCDSRLNADFQTKKFESHDYSCNLMQNKSDTQWKLYTTELYLYIWRSCSRRKCVTKNMADFTIQYNTIQYNTIQYNTIQYNTIQYNTIQYNTIQYNTIQYNKIYLSTVESSVYINKFKHAK